MEANMANVNHSALTDPYLHEPKGAAAATSGQVYVANGSGSGTWTTKESLVELSLEGYLLLLRYMYLFRFLALLLK